MSPLSPTAFPDLLTQLQHLTTGLLFQSESDAPLLVLTCARPADGLPNAALLSSLMEPVDAPVQVVSLAYFLRNHTADRLDPDRQVVAARYQALQAFMEQHLPGVQVYRIGSEPRIRAYALGEAAPEHLAGFMTVLIET